MKNFFLLLLPALTFVLFAQDRQDQDAAAQASGLPSGFRSFTLGLSRDAVEEALKNDSFFRYTGQPDVSLLDTMDRSVLEANGTTFIKRGIFLFYEDRLYGITLELREDDLDYFGVYSALQEKYGPPSNVNPQSAYWQNDSVQLSVERPLLVKYLDLAVFKEIVEQGNVDNRYRGKAKADFLEQF